MAGTLQAVHEAPQLATLVLLRHDEPHEWKPAPHVKPHDPSVHVELPFEGTGHEVTQLPQCVGSAAILISHPFDDNPSQSENPGLQTNPHAVPLHDAAACAGTGHAVHALPQVAVLLLFAQVPPQSW